MTENPIVSFVMIQPRCSAMCFRVQRPQRTEYSAAVHSANGVATHICERTRNGKRTTRVSSELCLRTCTCSSSACECMLLISALSCEHALQHFCIAMHVAHFPPMLRCCESKRSTVEVTQRQTSCSAYAMFKIESETRIVWWRAARS